MGWLSWLTGEPNEEDKALIEKWSAWGKMRLRQTGWPGFKPYHQITEERELENRYYYFQRLCFEFGVDEKKGVEIADEWYRSSGYAKEWTYEADIIRPAIKAWADERDRNDPVLIRGREIEAEVRAKNRDYWQNDFDVSAARKRDEITAWIEQYIEQNLIRHDGIPVGTVSVLKLLPHPRQFVADAVYKVTTSKSYLLNIPDEGERKGEWKFSFEYAPEIFKRLGIAAHEERSRDKYLKPAHSGMEPYALAKLCFGGLPIMEHFDKTAPLTIPDKLRPEHSLVLGKSGSGKSTTLFHMIHEDIKRGKASIIFIEPKGSWTRAVSYLSDFVGNDRLRIIDPKYAPAFNFFALPKRLQNYPPKQRREIIANITEQYSRAFKAFNVKIDESANQETALSYVSEVVFSMGGSLSDMQRILEDPAPKYEKSSIMPEIERYMDDDMRGYFENQYYGGFVVGSRKSLAGKLRKLLRGGFNFREMFDANVNKVDLYERMQTPGSVTLINTEQGRLKPEASSFLGRLMLSQIFDAAIQRQSFGENTHPVYVYVDEAHLYVDETIEQFMLQTREAKVSLVLATQKLESLKEARSAVLSETAIKIVAPSPADIKAASDNTNQTSEELFRSLTREGEFAVYYRPMASAVKVLIDNTVKKADYMTADEHRALIDRNYHHFKDEPRPPQETKTEKRPTISLKKPLRDD